jgi:hypothetical protein
VLTRPIVKMQTTTGAEKGTNIQEKKRVSGML